MSSRFRITQKVTLVLALSAYHVVWAARPMITDDARVVDPKSCQVESWVKSTAKSTELWAVPACNFTGNLEIALGGNNIRETGKETSDTVAQLKTIFKPLTTNGWGVGMALGAVQHPQYGENRDWYTYVPVSFSFDDDNFVLHTNLGWSKKHENSQNTQKDDLNNLTWGLGFEKYLAYNAYLIAETYGENGKDPYAQVGIRYWVVPKHLQLDATVGDQWQGVDQSYISLGFRFLSSAFLP